MAANYASSPTPPPARRCLATTRRGHPCRAWAVPGTGYCFAHRRQAAALPVDHPCRPPFRRLQTIDDVIADLFEKLSFLSGLLDQTQDMDSFLKLVAVYGRASTHLARLMREKRLLPAASADAWSTVIGQALDEISQELGIEL